MSGGGSSGSSSGGTQITKSEPWAGQEPYLRDVLDRAQGLAGIQKAYYPGPTYAMPSSDTEAALAAQARRARDGSPLVASATKGIADTLGGAYLDGGNPYLQQAVTQAANAVRPQLDAQFAGAGRYGSGAYAHALTSALADTAGQLAYQNYAQERQNQLQAAQLAPTLANQDYYDIAKLAEAGAQRDDTAQRAIDDAVQRFNYTQDEPWERLARYNALIQGNYGGTTTTTTANNAPHRSLGADLLTGAGAGLNLVMPGVGSFVSALGRLF